MAEKIFFKKEGRAWKGSQRRVGAVCEGNKDKGLGKRLFRLIQLVLYLLLLWPPRSSPHHSLTVSSFITKLKPITPLGHPVPCMSLYSFLSHCAGIFYLVPSPALDCGLVEHCPRVQQ